MADETDETEEKSTSCHEAIDNLSTVQGVGLAIRGLTLLVLVVTAFTIHNDFQQLINPVLTIQDNIVLSHDNTVTCPDSYSCWPQGCFSCAWPPDPTMEWCYSYDRQCLDPGPVSTPDPTPDPSTDYSRPNTCSQSETPEDCVLWWDHDLSQAIACCSVPCHDRLYERYAEFFKKNHMKVVCIK